ncbi:MAG TPA: methylthioribulose 1-phosphate dehydratase [Gammaproteobacteria bacterium]|nr:methylthioribulose 1-phosphate dehydratase [Gammaproteobacteria bacterium]
MSDDFTQRATELVEAGRFLYQRGMVPATSGNFSAKLDDGTLAVTVSGRHKGKLTVADIMRVNDKGESLDGRRPSAETLLHVQIYSRTNARSVLHPHSVNATLLSKLTTGHLVLQDYELLKAFPGVDTHECRVTVPIFDNDQNIGRLADQVDTYMTVQPEPVFGYLINGHGFYTWGENIESTLRHVEAFEFLFECEMRIRGKSK